MGVAEHYQSQYMDAEAAGGLLLVHPSISFNAVFIISVSYLNKQINKQNQNDAKD